MLKVVLIKQNETKNLSIFPWQRGKCRLMIYNLVCHLARNKKMTVLKNYNYKK
jgi:hypothetical protein